MKAAEKENPWHRDSDKPWHFLVEAAIGTLVITAAGIIWYWITEWAIEFFWKNIW